MLLGGGIERYIRHHQFNPPQFKEPSNTWPDGNPSIPLAHAHRHLLRNKPLRCTAPPNNGTAGRINRSDGPRRPSYSATCSFTAPESRIHLQDESSFGIQPVPQLAPPLISTEWKNRSRSRNAPFVRPLSRPAMRPFAPTAAGPL